MDFLKKKNKESKKTISTTPEQDYGGVNLIVEERSKEVSQDLLKKNVFQILGSALLALLIVGIVYGGIRAYGSQREKEIQTIRDVIQKTESQISNLERNAAVLSQFQTKLTSLKTLLDTHISMVKFFRKLEELTLSNVSYSNVSLSGEGTVMLSAVSTDYTSVGRQLLAYEKAPEIIKKAKITAVNGMLSQTGDIAGVSFNLSLILQKEWLSKKEPLTTPSETPTLIPIPTPISTTTPAPTQTPVPTPVNEVQK